VSVSTIKAEKVVAAALGLLERDLSIAQLVYRESSANFKGAAGDIVTMTLPAYLDANERALRSGGARTKSNLAENKIAVKLTDDLYIDLPITDEELNLDIAEFGRQVLNPVTGAIARKVDDKLVALMASPTDGFGNDLVYHTDLTHTSGTDDPYETAVDARAALNNARVPFTERAIVCGSDLESDFLKSEHFVRADQSGTTQTLREARIGRVAGFEVYSSPGLAPDEGYAFHRTAYAMSNLAPAVPAGAPWGAVGNYKGAAIRTVRVFDPNEVEDRLVADSWLGASAVTDAGHFDAAGRFVPSATEVATNEVEVGGGTPTEDSEDVRRLVRAVKITVE